MLRATVSRYRIVISSSRHSSARISAHSPVDSPKRVPDSYSSDTNSMAGRGSAHRILRQATDTMANAFLSYRHQVNRPPIATANVIRFWAEVQFADVDPDNGLVTEAALAEIRDRAKSPPPTITTVPARVDDCRYEIRATFSFHRQLRQAKAP
jgi:hypothetical protein